MFGWKDNMLVCQGKVEEDLQGHFDAEKYGELVIGVVQRGNKDEAEGGTIGGSAGSKHFFLTLATNYSPVHIGKTTTETGTQRPPRGPGPTSKESATSGIAPLKKKSPFTATKTTGKVI
ncbi:hypothetical protein PIB30_058903 [Stylosanthes scabra]|uniref:Uncharacterized protein n=1 Tax=Stylosanthes scabra TaxID=79078 RepID=A0ABU6RK35_9FABA|nr:hypothetical protein [Stylosanthes scabra]